MLQAGHFVDDADGVVVLEGVVGEQVHLGRPGGRQQAGDLDVLGVGEGFDEEQGDEGLRVVEEEGVRVAVDVEEAAKV